MGKGGGSQTVTQTLDRSSQQYTDFMRGKAKTFAAEARQGGPRYAGAHGQFTRGLENMNQLRQGMQPFMNMNQQMAGNLGFATGYDPAEIQSRLDPNLNYQLDAVGGQYDTLRDRMKTGLQQQAAQSKAFGGSRHGVAEGIGMGELGQAEMQQKGGIYRDAWAGAQGQYQQDQQRAMQAAMAGQQGMFQGNQFLQQLAQGQMGAGDYLRNIQNQQLQGSDQQNMMALQMLQAGYGGQGSTTTQPGGGGNFLGGALGGAMAGSSLGLPGIIGGGLIGGLGSLF